MGGIVPILQMMPGVNSHRVEKLASDPGCLASLAKFSVFSSIALQEKRHFEWVEQDKQRPEGQNIVGQMKELLESQCGWSRVSGMRLEDGRGEVEGSILRAVTRTWGLTVLPCPVAAGTKAALVGQGG